MPTSSVKRVLKVPSCAYSRSIRSRTRRSRARSRRCCASAGLLVTRDIVRRAIAVPGSGVARARLPTGLLGPLVRAPDDLPEEGRLGVGVRRAIVGELRGKAPFEVLVGRRVVRVGAQVVAEQQRELLGEAARPPDMDVGARLARRFTEVPLGALGVVRAVHV